MLPIFQSTLSIVLGVLALIVTTGWLVGESLNKFVPRSRKDAIESLWIRALVIQGALWTISVLFGGLAIRSFCREFPPHRGDIAAVGLSLLALLWLSKLAPPLHEGEKHLLDQSRVKEQRLILFAHVGRWVALLQIVGLLLAGAAMARLALFPAGPLAARMAEFVDLRDFTNGFLTVASLILTAGAVGTELRRRTVNVLQGGEEMFGREYVILFGLAYTFLLALVYAPIAITTYHVGDALRHEALQGSIGDAKSWLDMQKGVTEALDLNGSGLLPASTLAVIGPLIGTIFAGVFGKGGDDSGDESGKS